MICRNENNAYAILRQEQIFDNKTTQIELNPLYNLYFKLRK